MNANTHARAVLYNTENSAYFQEPASRAIAVNVAIHGKYRRTNTMNAKADSGVNGAFPVNLEGVFNLSESISASSSPT